MTSEKDLGALLRDAGVYLVGTGIDAHPEYAEWRESAKQHFLDALKAGPTTLELALLSHPKPPPGFPPNGLGALVIGLVHAGKIVRAGHERALKGSRHAGVVGSWALADTAPQEQEAQ